MKILKSFTVCCMVLMTVGSTAQSSDREAIRASLTAFSQAGDANDAETLDNCLDDNYRIVMNRLFGSREVSIMPKSVYLEKIKSKEFGGDKRKLSIEDVVINGTTAMAKVTFSGKKMNSVSLITLVKYENGQWKLVNDVPIIL